MIALLAALAVGVVFLGGGLAPTHLFEGLACTAVGSIALGTLFAMYEGGRYQKGYNVEAGLTVAQLRAAIVHCPEDMKVYVGDNGLHVAGGLFECLLDGGRAVVIERQAETPTSLTPGHDLF